MKKHIDLAVIQASLGFTKLVIIFTAMFALGGCVPKPIKQEQQVFYYELEEGENGVTMFTINSDSTVTTEYIFEGKCYRLDSISGKTYEDTMKTVYSSKQ